MPVKQPRFLKARGSENPESWERQRENVAPELLGVSPAVRLQTAQVGGSLFSCRALCIQATAPGQAALGYSGSFSFVYWNLVLVMVCNGFFWGFPGVHIQSGSCTSTELLPRACSCFLQLACSLKGFTLKLSHILQHQVSSRTAQLTANRETSTQKYSNTSDLNTSQVP